MASDPKSVGAPTDPQGAVNGAAMAAYLAAGIGGFLMGAVVLLNEADILAAPALYGPAGGVSGRTTLATVAWLAVWGVLHRRWRNRDVRPAPVYTLTLVLIGAGVLATLPPVWGLL